MRSVMQKVMGIVAVSVLAMLPDAGVASAQSAASELGYAWFDGSAAAPLYQYTSRQPTSTTSIRATRTAVGRYEVFFGGMTLGGGNVQVTPYGASNQTCNVVSWSKEPTGVRALVACFAAAGAPADSPFAIQYVSIGDPDRTGQVAYAWSSNVVSADRTPFNGTYLLAGAGAWVQRLDRGYYLANLPFRSAAMGTGFGHIAITTYGPTPVRCAAAPPPSVATDVVYVACVDVNGAPADAQFSLARSRATTTFPTTLGGYASVEGGRLTESWSTPSRGRGVTYANVNGLHRLTFAGLGGPGGTAELSSTLAARSCQIVSWTQSGADEVVTVSCTGPFKVEFGRMDPIGR